METLVKGAANTTPHGPFYRPSLGHPSGMAQVGVTTLPWRSRPGTAIRSNSGRVGIFPTTTGADAPAAPLDEIVDGAEGVGVGKVDAGGLSPEILASGSRLLRRDRPLVAAEAASDAERNALRALLSPLGYREAERHCWTATWVWSPSAARCRVIAGRASRQLEQQGRLGLLGRPGTISGDRQRFRPARACALTHVYPMRENRRQLSCVLERPGHGSGEASMSFTSGNRRSWSQGTVGACAVELRARLRVDEPDWRS